MARPGTTQVFYDGECRLCTLSRDWAQRRDRAGGLSFCDLNDPAASAATAQSTATLRGEMWARLPDGSLASGFAAWLAVLRALPRWRVTAAILGAAPLRRLGRLVYRAVARHRHLVRGR